MRNAHRKRIRWATALLFLAIASAHAGPLVHQPWDGTSPGHTIVDWIGFEEGSEWLFDDFTIQVDWYLDVLTIDGYEEFGACDSLCNESVTAEIWDGLPGSFGGSVVLTSTFGVENEDGTLSIDFGGQFLPAGTYWIRAWVRRDLVDWYRWRSTTPTHGDESYWWNPGGGWGGGPDPVPYSEMWGGPPRDMAFHLDGSPAGDSLPLVGPVPGVAGVTNTWYVSGANEGETIYFVYGLRAGSTNVPGCPGVTVDIRRPSIFATMTADFRGNAEVSLPVPGAAGGRTIYFQSVERATCRVSPLVEYAFP